MRLTPGDLVAATGCSGKDAMVFAPHINEAAERYEFDAPHRLAAWLAQFGHESQSLATMAESLNYSVEGLLKTFGRHRISEDQARMYGRAPGRPADQRMLANILYGGEWGAKNLGNTNPEDGWRYRGRGGGLTGRSNYTAATHRMRAAGITCPNFESEPDAVADPKWAVWTFSDFWAHRGCNALADTRTDGGFEALTRRINGGMNGYEDRLERWGRAKAALASVAATGSPAAPIATPAPAPAQEQPVLAPQGQETPMVAPIVASLGSSFLAELARKAIAAFTPIAAEKLNKELDRHVGNQELSAQAVTAVLETVQTITQRPDPLDAVAVLRVDKQLAQQAEVAVTDRLAQLAPMLDRLQAMEESAWAAEEASRAAADARARDSDEDQDRFLTRAIVGMAVGLILLMLILIPVLVWLKADAGTVGTVVGLFAGAGLAIVQGLNTRIQHRYGSSRGSAMHSAAKDALAQEILRKQT